jgi:hypothetical protein
MEGPILFTETQRFKQWWIWLFLISMNGFFLYGIYQQLIAGRTWGDKPLSNGALLAIAVLLLLLTLFFGRIKLITRVTAEGIYVRFAPFQRQAAFYPFSQLDRCYLRRYSPLREFGGWGMRLSTVGKGQAFNIAGREGLQLCTTDGNRILIGTQKPTALEASLYHLGQNKPA